MSLVRSLVRSSKRNRIEQLGQEAKKQIGLMTYKRMQLIRQQQDKKLDSMEKSKLVRELNRVEKKIDELKRADASKSKELLFYSHTSQFNNALKDLKMDTRMLEHLEDISTFLTNQSEYDELIERYNVGLRMSQEEKVEKTAAKVGLQVPQ